MRSKGRQAGFTLVELVVTLVLSSVVVSFVALFITRPVMGFTDQARRARLVDAAESALQRITRDVRRALPNSVRVMSAGGVAVIELLGTLDGARYRAQPPGGADAVLDFSAHDTSFNVLGPFTQIAKPWSSTSHHLAIYNVGVAGADAYELADVITPAGTSISIAADGATGEDRVELSPGFRFAYESPTQRVFLVDGAVSYLCDTSTGTLIRYEGYAIAAAHASRDSHAELVGAGAGWSLMADGLVDCAFVYTPGTARRAGLVSLRFVVRSQGEAVSLLSQVHVDNAP